MNVEEIECWSDALFLMENQGFSRDDAAKLALQFFNWGILAAFSRMRPSRPLPADAPPIKPEQLSLIEEDAAPKPKPAPKPTAPAKVARTWPADFTLTDPLIQFATNRGFTLVEVQRMWERFRDRNMAKGEKYADWNAAWRTWVNNQVEFKNRDNRQSAPNNHIDGRL